MPPRKRAAAKPPPTLRESLDADLAELDLPDHRALIQLARKLADHLDGSGHRCTECDCQSGPDAATVLRYADTLEALGIGSIPQQEPADGFTLMVGGFHGRRP